MKYLISIFLILLSATGFAQIPGMVHYGQEEGLNASFTYMLDQDVNGFIWIGSDNGLFRFDGTEFKQYSQKDGLKNIEILQPIALANNEVFIVPYLSNFAYERKGKIYHSGNNPELSKIQYKPQFRYSAAADSLQQKVALFSSAKEIFVYEKGHITKISVNLPARFKPGAIIKYDFKGNLLMMDGNSLFNYNIYTKRLTELVYTTPSPALVDLDKNDYMQVSVSSFTQFNDGLISQWRDNKLYLTRKIDNHHCEVVFARSFKSNIYQVSMQPDGSLWVSLSDGGVFRTGLSKEQQMGEPVIFLKNYIVNATFVDHDGNVWFSTKNDGLFFMPRQLLKNYSNYRLNGNDANITAIAANKKSIFLGYNMETMGIYEHNALRNFTIRPNSKRECRAIFADSDYAIFASATESYRMKLDNHHVETIGAVKLTKNIVQIAENKLLFCTSDSVQIYNYKTSERNAIYRIKSFSALAYGSDSLFLGGFKDLYKFNLRNMHRKLFLKDCFFTDLKPIGKNLYIGATNGNGIYIFNNIRIVRKITEADGLASNQVKRLTAQNDHIFWAATNSGLSRIYIGKEITIRSYTRNDGLPSDRVSGCVIRNDTLFAGTTKGLAILPLKDLLQQQPYLDKKVIINSVLLGGKEYLEPEDGISELFSDNPVIFNLSFPDYISQGKVSYRYQIEGLSDKWQTSKSPKILLNTLDPGKYTLKVYGMGYNGKRSQQLTVLRFEIEPRFWQAWWFIALCIIAISSASFMLILYFLQKRRDKKMQEVLYDKKIAELELQAIKAQINPHFIYNCLNSIQFLLYKKDYKETENYLDIFARMIRSTLHYSEKTFMPISEEVDYLRLYLDMEKLRFKSHFGFEIIVADNVDQRLEIPSLLVQPFVENAIKHGIANLKERKGHIEIAFKSVNSLLVISIRDNGTGIQDKSVLTKKLNSFGIRLSKKRIKTFSQLFNTDITMEINDLFEKGGQGTEIKLYFKQS